MKTLSNEDAVIAARGLRAEARSTRAFNETLGRGDSARSVQFRESLAADFDRIASQLDPPLVIDGREAVVMQEMPEGVTEIEWLDNRSRVYVTQAQMEEGTMRPLAEESEDHGAPA